MDARRLSLEDKSIFNFLNVLGNEDNYLNVNNLIE